jgi:DNA (cytosine-5)-methyltransferase 1
MSRHRYLSLFSGGGGFDAGLQAAGLKCQVAVDHDALALEHIASNLKIRTAEADLADIRPSSFRETDIIVAGPPCQGFSTLGKREESDPRNALLVVPARFACALRPRFVIIENVSGARSPRNRHHLEKSSLLLRAAGYKVATIDVEMGWFGVAQRRRRTLQFAWRGHSEFRLPSPSPRQYSRLDDMLRDLNGVANHDPTPLVPGSRSAQIARAIRPGQKLCNVRVSPAAVRTWAIPEVFGKTSGSAREVLEALVRLRRRARKRDWGDADPVGARDLARYVGFPVHGTLRTLVAQGYVRRCDDAYDLVNTFNGKYRRPSPEGLAPTVDTRFCDAHYVLHPHEDRPFTVREAARVQGFPDQYRFWGSQRAQRRLIANAVPPPAGEAIGRAVSEFLDFANN